MSKPKKKFAETTVGKLLFGAASLVNPTLGNLISGVSSPAEAIAAIGKSNVSSEDKIKLQQLIFEQQNKEMESITSRWQAIPCQIHGFLKTYAHSFSMVYYSIFISWYIR